MKLKKLYPGVTTIDSTSCAYHVGPATITCKKHGEISPFDMQILNEPICVNCFYELLDKNNCIIKNK
jgi:hypothetical protein